jgi:hypothetical protein
LLGEPPPLMTTVTRDNRVRKNAEVLGYAVTSTKLTTDVTRERPSRTRLLIGQRGE